MNKKALFGIYLCGYILYGFSINCMGSIIPYFSQASGIKQTQFSFLFLARALGYFIGGFANKKFQNILIVIISQLQFNYSVEFHFYYLLIILNLHIQGCAFFLVQHFVAIQKLLETFVIFLLFIEFQISFTSWTPNYLILLNVISLQTVALSASLLWSSNVFMRIVFIFIPGKVSTRLNNIYTMNICCVIFVSIIVLFGFHMFAAFAGSITIGGAIARVIPLSFAIAAQFGLNLILLIL